MANPAFDELQAKLRDFWHTLTLRSIGDLERTVVVVHSIGLDVPDHLVPVFPAYEERFLPRPQPHEARSRVVYVSSSRSIRACSTTTALVPSSTRARHGAGSSTSRWWTAARCAARAKAAGATGSAGPRARAVGDPEVAFILPVLHDARRGRASPSGSASDLRLRSRSPAGSGRREVVACSRRRTSRIPSGSRWTARETWPARSAARATKSGRARAVLKLDQGVSGFGNALVPAPPQSRTCEAAIEVEDPSSRSTTTFEHSTTRRDRRGADRGRHLPQPERPAPHEPGRAGWTSCPRTTRFLGGPHGQNCCHARPTEATRSGSPPRHSRSGAGWRARA